jgi:hypothetical protein
MSTREPKIEVATRMYASDMRQKLPRKHVTEGGD